MISLHPCEAIIGSIKPWIGSLLAKCYLTGISKDFLISKEIDHICYRCQSNEEYIDVRTRLTANDVGSLLVEGMIGGRPISTFHLKEPYQYENWSIPCIEVASPKPNRIHQAGLEHLEVVIGNTNDGFGCSKNKLLDFTSLYPAVEFNLKAIDKDINADVSLELESAGSIKFHLRSLFDVCNHELIQGSNEEIPSDYFTKKIS
jgi:hypothetical protein